MKTALRYISIGWALFGAGILAFAASGEIPASSKRGIVLDQARGLAKAASPEAVQPPANLKNPFNPVAVEVVNVVKPVSDDELLAVLAERIPSTGVMGRADAMFLLIKGQKSAKVGDKLAVSFGGSTYEVELTSIDAKNFSLRYNQAEITRPIKTGKNP